MISVFHVMPSFLNNAPKISWTGPNIVLLALNKLHVTWYAWDTEKSEKKILIRFQRVQLNCAHSLSLSLLSLALIEALILQIPHSLYLIPILLDFLLDLTLSPPLLSTIPFSYSAVVADTR